MEYPEGMEVYKANEIKFLAKERVNELWRENNHVLSKHYDKDLLLKIFQFFAEDEMFVKLEIEME